MANAPLPSRERLHKLLHYHPATGELLWRARPVSDFQEGKRGALIKAKVWNKAVAGKAALRCRKANGYLCGSIDTAQVLQHRVIWKWMTGDEPEHIDHINGDPADNRWVNLRNVPRCINMRNMKLSKANRSGRVGVYLVKGKWKAKGSIGKRSICLGTFAHYSDAVKAREEWEDGRGFHENHGFPR